MEGRYVPLLRLGVGARADIYLGRLSGAESFSNLVVLKRALGVSVSADEAREALVREAEIGVSARHPHVVSTLELTKIPEGLVLVMEYVTGVTFGALIAHLAREDAVVPGPVAARLIADAALGLAHLHRLKDSQGTKRQLVHADVSPSNLLLGEDGFARVADFGCAGVSAATGSSAALFFASPPYCAPEHIEGRGAVQASDVFALGMVLRALLTGGTPVDGDSLDAHLLAVCGGQFRALPDDCDPMLAQIVREMTTRNPESRPVMEDIALRLEEMATGRGGNRHQVRMFLVAEMGRALDQRKRRLQSLEAGEGKIAAAESTATFAVLDALLDGSLPELAGTRVDSGQR